MWPPQIITYSVFVRNLPPLRTFLLLFNSIWATVGSRHQSRTFDTPAARREFFITSTVWGTQLPLRPRIKTACNFTLYGIQTTNDDKSFVTTLDAKLDNKKNSCPGFPSIIPLIDGCQMDSDRFGLTLFRLVDKAPIRAPRSTTDQILQPPSSSPGPSLVLVPVAPSQHIRQLQFNSIQSDRS